MKIEIQPINGHYNLKFDAAEAGEKCDRPEITFGGVSVAADFSAILVNVGGGSYEWREVNNPEIVWVLQGQAHETVGVELSGQHSYGQRRDFFEATSREVVTLTGKSSPSKYARLETRTFVSFNETDEWVMDGEQVSESVALNKIEELKLKGWK